MIPPIIQSTTVYLLRNGSDIIKPYCRLSHTTNSFIPSTIRKWKSLDNSVRNVNSLKQFKTELRNMDHHTLHIDPKQYVCGPRKLSTVITQLPLFSFLFE